ncbi:Holliday junction ATP-dependent DNA helicase RuvB [Borrelia miyamotoi]|uniref:Holliday junction branch migration complex subunit RuvB n=1 Tax=Borrelia miyamotoi TaxID=47466 RepID=A0AAP8YS96_9SPIR|nr:Holliday junction branch migration DNA helicase RuvB [Borrelia miyamotoi]AHH05394.1 Holliday junction DNA helicase ruvB [Borrelia miyamotoi FR64b]ATQ15151.1 Holliday junction branch migration DNA helicase RuvB [Borrelia miyamotoi]ATQ16333.1 Holliday junction branch migration DNA helicase RuvB [Borrelia miyamotoi]ATQ17476.1 Holliday junction branch migration DNA helicase RuvB [Borrelia miyamotoi]ATQ18021.1 Holliday junction branch migration DNA helicase RuvB [Borrelia miyamotoi]
MDFGERTKFLSSDKDFLYDSNENELRPKSLGEFVGQSHIKENLNVFIRASRERNEALDHIFLSGPPGLGKTTLASIIAFEMNATIKVTSAPALDKPKDIVGILTTLDDKSILFVDEIHRLKPVVEEMLYIAMEDYKIDWIIGQGPAARTVRMPIPQFTLIGATTKPGKVATPLYARFGIVSRFELYNEDELVGIIKRNSVILNVNLEDKAARLLAKSSRGTPRIANRLLRRMRDFAQVGGYNFITEGTVSFGLKMLKIDHEGLDEQDRNILRSLILKFKGGPVGVETLAISVGETADSLEDFYEPYLILKGLIERTSRGRKATDFAYFHLNLKKNDSLNGEQHGYQRVLF